MRYIQEFQVEGTMAFPIDMLRYDQCFPASEDQSPIIAGSLRYESKCEHWRVRLKRYVASAKDLPTIDRWRSFSTRVDSATIQTRRLT